MRQLISIVVCLCFVSYAFSAYAESADTSTNDDKTSVHLTENAKLTEGKPATESRITGSPEEVDQQRTHTIQNSILEQLKGLQSSLQPQKQQSLNNLAPSIGSVSPIVSGHSLPIYGGKMFPSFGSSYLQPVSHSIPVVAPAAVQTAHIPVVPQALVSKPVMPFNKPVAPQSFYTVSEQIIHKPIYTEDLEVIRRPVVTEVEEVIHKPVVTELQQIIKKPLYTQHVVKSPSYGSIKQEVYLSPLHLPGESVHLVDKPVSQFVELPTKIVQPVAAHVVQNPVVHQQLSTATNVPSKPVSAGVIGSYPSYGFGYGSGMSSSSGYGSGYGTGYGCGYGSGYGSGHGSGYASGYGSVYGSGYGSGHGSVYGSGHGSGHGSGYASGYGSVYGSGYGSAYGSGHGSVSGSGSGLSPSYGSAFYPYTYADSILSGESIYQYFIPSPSCRAIGNCLKGVETTEKSLITDANSAVAAPSPYIDYQSRIPWNRVLSGTPSNINSPTISPLIDQPSTDQKQTQPAISIQSSEHSGNSVNTSTIVDSIKKDPEAWKEFQHIVQKVTAKYSPVQSQNNNEFDVEASLKMIAEAAKSNPVAWEKIFNSELKFKIQSMDKLSADHSRKSN